MHFKNVRFPTDSDMVGHQLIKIKILSYNQHVIKSQPISEIETDFKTDFKSTVT